MNFDLTEDQREIKRTAREFLASRYTMEKIRAIALDGEPDPHWDEIAELGWPDIAEYGIVELAVVAEELGYALAPSPLAAHWAAKLLHPGSGGPRDGRDVGRGRLRRPRDADLDGRAAHGRQDRGAERRRRRHARRHRRGRPPLRGRARPTRRSSRRARSTPRGRCSRSASTGGGEELSGDHFGRAWHAIAVMAAAESVGVAARVTGMAVDYAKERKQFGRAIGSYQAVSHACAQMFLETEGARSVTYWAAWALDHDPEQAFMAANCAKAYASDAAVNVTRSALQVHGGIGFTWEHDLHLFLKRAEANAHAFGDARWHREQVAAATLIAALDALTAGSGRRRAAWSRRRPSVPAPPSGSVDAARRAAARSASPCPAVSSAPTRPSSDGPDMSERIAFGAAHATHGSRTNVSNDVTLSLIEPMIFCWRRARVRSFSRGLHSFLRVRASASACLPSISCSPPFSRSV